VNYLNFVEGQNNKYERYDTCGVYGAYENSHNISNHKLDICWEDEHDHNYHKIDENRENENRENEPKNWLSQNCSCVLVAVLENNDRQTNRGVQRRLIVAVTDATSATVDATAMRSDRQRTRHDVGYDCTTVKANGCV
jgi:hypothetical protein